MLGFGDLTLPVSVSAAQFLSRAIPFVFNIWFVRQLGADDGTVSVWISPLLCSFLLLQCNDFRCLQMQALAFGVGGST